MSDEERKEFWDQVAFYNYIQEFVGEEARQQPTEEMWGKVVDPFKETLVELKPDILIVLGYELQSNLSERPLELVVCKMKHPSGGGFRYSDWQSAIQSALS